MAINYPGGKTGYPTFSGQQFGPSRAGLFSPPVPVVHSTLANESIHPQDNGRICRNPEWYFE